MYKIKQVGIMESFIYLKLLIQEISILWVLKNGQKYLQALFLILSSCHKYKCQLHYKLQKQ